LATKRRAFTLFAGAALTAPHSVFAQTPRVYRLGWLWTSDEATTRPLFAAFLVRMRELGYVVGKNLANEARWAQGNPTRYPALADELIALKPDVLLGIQEAALVLQAKTPVIPIVLLSSADPVSAGLVKSLARPGTNVTGVTGVYEQLLVKQIELMSEVAPGISRIAFLGNSTSQSRVQFERMAREAAAARRLMLATATADDADGIRRAFDDFSKQHIEGVVVLPSGPMTFLRHEIARNAIRLRLPSISGMSQFADAGGLINYAPHFQQPFGNEIPAFVDRILRGAKPADLPVQQVTKYDLVINLKTAQQIGLTIPRAVTLRADRIIE
jgi:putative tryptophan/tyrosine transport system substrate-binding protein